MKGDQTPIAGSSLQRSYEGGMVEVQQKAHVQAPAAETNKYCWIFTWLAVDVIQILYTDMLCYINVDPNTT